MILKTGKRRFLCQKLKCRNPSHQGLRIAETCVNMVLSPDFGALPPLICLPVSYADGGTTKPVIESEKRAI